MAERRQAADKQRQDQAAQQQQDENAGRARGERSPKTASPSHGRRRRLLYRSPVRAQGLRIFMHRLDRRSLAPPRQVACGSAAVDALQGRGLHGAGHLLLHAARIAVLHASRQRDVEQLLCDVAAVAESPIEELLHRGALLRRPSDRSAAAQTSPTRSASFPRPADRSGRSRNSAPSSNRRSPRRPRTPPSSGRRTCRALFFIIAVVRWFCSA